MVAARSAWPSHRTARSWSWRTVVWRRVGKSGSLRTMTPTKSYEESNNKLHICFVNIFLKCLFVLMFFIIMDGKNDIWLLVACAHTSCLSTSPWSNLASSVCICVSVCLGFPCKFLSCQEKKSVCWPLFTPAPCMHTLHLPATRWRFYIKCWLCSLSQRLPLCLWGLPVLSPKGVQYSPCNERGTGQQVMGDW